MRSARPSCAGTTRRASVTCAVHCPGSVFGIGPGGAIFLIALGAFYPIVVNTSQGARDVDRMLIRAALMMGAGPFTILRRVVLPAALPSVRSSAAFCCTTSGGVRPS